METYKLNINFELLKLQKQILIERIGDWERTNPEGTGGELLDGLLGLLDSIQDQAVEKGYATEEEVFDKFPNGFSSWRETHYEVVAAISQIARQDFPDGRVQEVEERYGIGGLYDLANDLTDNFERNYVGNIGDGDFFDTVENFLEKELGY